MAKVICFASAKGGAGKTVITASCGKLLSHLGFKVLLVDTDAATNGLSLLYLDEVNSRRDVKQEGRPMGLYESNAGIPSTLNLSDGPAFCPATFTFQNTENVAMATYQSNLGKLIQWARNVFDYILLDAQAGSDPFAQEAMNQRISDGVVIVAEFDPISAAGVDRLKALEGPNLQLERTWILINKLLPEFRTSFQSFFEIAHYAAPLPWDAEVVRSFARRRLPLDLEEGNTFTSSLLESVESIFDDQVSMMISTWRHDKAEALRKPILERIEAAKNDYDYVVRLRKKAERDRERSKAIRKQFVYLFGGAIASVAVFISLVYPSVFTSNTVVLSSIPIVATFVAVILERARLFATGDDINAKLESLQIEEAVAREQLLELRALSEEEFLKLK